MNPSTYLLVAMCLPAVASPLIILMGERHRNLREMVTLTTGILTFGFVLQLLPLVMAGTRPEIHLLQIFPGVNLAFQIEPLGMLFAMVASGLWVVTSCVPQRVEVGIHLLSSRLRAQVPPCAPSAIFLKASQLMTYTTQKPLDSMRLRPTTPPMS